jgi:hypothetical protein
MLKGINNMKDNEKMYFAAKEPKECVKTLMEKAENYYNTLESFGYWDKIRDMYAAWHGAYNTGIGDAHQITFTGDDGEYTELVANHLRNIGRHMLNMVTAVRPAMETRAVNTDYKSQIQTKLGNGLLDYYMRASGKNVEERLKLACEYGICLGAGWIKMAWNQNLGEITNFQEIQQATRMKRIDSSVNIPKATYEGDIDFKLIMPFNVIEDLSKEDIQHDWRLVRSFKNRFDLIAVYPDLEEELLKLPSKDEYQALNMFSLNGTSGQTDDVIIWEFYHERTEALPDGRYMFFCNDKTVMYDGTLPYRSIPLYSLKPSRILGTTLGYSDMFDVLPLQNAMNLLYSTILTNQAAFGVQTILNPSTSNIEPSQIGNGLAILNYNPQGGVPSALQLTSTPPEIFNYLNFLIQTSETISGINSTVRGNPEAALRSGSAIAMIQSNAVQYMSNLQAEYIKLMENIGKGIIDMLIDFADSPRIADIVGESGKAYVKTFKGDDLRSINRVIVDSANPLSKTISGRINMADNLMQYGDITPRQYMNVINTGNLETATDPIIFEEMSIKKENEELLSGKQVVAFFLDLHLNHIKGHRSLISDPDMRKDPELVKLVGDHIKMHIDLLRETDPDLLMSLGEQPLQPKAVQPEGQPIQETLQTPTTLPPIEQAVNEVGATPQEPRLPQGFEGSPITPEQNLERIK